MDGECLGYFVFGFFSCFFVSLGSGVCREYLQGSVQVGLALCKVKVLVLILKVCIFVFSFILFGFCVKFNLV